MRPIEQLAQVQALDAANDGIEQRLNEIRAELLDRTAIQAVEAQLAEVTATVATIESEQRDLELETEQLRAKQKAEEDKLYGGKVANPKELTSLTQEVDQIKRQIAQHDDRMVEVMSRLDAARTEQHTHAATLAELTEQRAARETEVKNEARALLRQQQELKKQIEVTRADIAPEHLQRYDRLRAAKGGLAVAEVLQRICQGCRVGLNNTEANRLRGDALVACSSCGRLIYGNV